MTDAIRLRAVRRVKVLRAKMQNKAAMFRVRQELKKSGHPSSQASIYNWADRFKIILR